MSVVTLSPRNNSIVRLNSSLLGIDRDGGIETMTWRLRKYRHQTFHLIETLAIKLHASCKYTYSNAKTFQILLFSKVLCVLMYVSCTTNVLDALPSFFLNFSSLLYFNLTKYKAFCSRNLKYLMLLWLQKIGPAPLNLKFVFTIEFSEKRASYKIQHRYIGATILNSGLAKNK